MNVANSRFTDLESKLSRFFYDRSVEPTHYEEVVDSYKTLIDTKSSLFDSFHQFPVKLLTQLIEATVVYEVISLLKDLGSITTKGLIFPGVEYYKRIGISNQHLSHMLAARRYLARRASQNGTLNDFRAEFACGLQEANVTQKSADERAKQYVEIVNNLFPRTTPGAEATYQEIVGRTTLALPLGDFQCIGLQRDIVLSLPSKEANAEIYTSIPNHLINAITEVQSCTPQQNRNLNSSKLFHIDYDGGVNVKLFRDSSQSGTYATPYQGESWQLAVVLAMLYFLMQDRATNTNQNGFHRPLFVPWVGTGRVDGMNISRVSYLYQKIWACMYNGSIRRMMFSDGQIKEFQEEIVPFSECKEATFEFGNNTFLQHEKRIELNDKSFYPIRTVNDVASICKKYIAQDRKMETQPMGLVNITVKVDRSLSNVPVTVEFDHGTAQARVEWQFDNATASRRIIETSMCTKYIKVIWQDRDRTFAVKVTEPVVLTIKFNRLLNDLTLHTRKAI